MDHSFAIPASDRVNSSESILVFGGPYSNLQALEALKRVAEEKAIPPKRIYCTGDLVAYCADPEETARLCFDWGVHIVQGNCEEQLGRGADDCGCGFDEGSACAVLSETWFDFARTRVSQEMCDWMKGLPKNIEFELAGRKVVIIHGSYEANNEFIFPSTEPGKKCESFDSSGADIVVAGHSGIPFLQRIREKVWFNPGVIGMPANDGTRDGWFGLLTSQDGGIRFSLHRLHYDAVSAAERMERKGGVSAYRFALLNGLWPSVDILPDFECRQSGHAIEESAMFLEAADNCR